MEERKSKSSFSVIVKSMLIGYWAAQLKTLVCISRSYDVLNTKTKCYEQRSETAWYVSNAILSAEKAAKYVLGHWGIENTHHYVCKRCVISRGCRKNKKQ